MYDRLFTWTVSQVNDAIDPSQVNKCLGITKFNLGLRVVKWSLDAYLITQMQRKYQDHQFGIVLLKFHLTLSLNSLVGN